jgi:voltage-gated potassium channel Kch
MDNIDHMRALLHGKKGVIVEVIPSGLGFRKLLYNWLLNPNYETNYHKEVDNWIGLLILANLFAMLFEHVPQVFDPNKALFHAFDVFSVTIFTIEYFLRFYLAPEDEEFSKKKMPRLRYIFSPFALIDFFAVAPFYFQSFLAIDLRVLRFLRLLRMLKLFRVLLPAISEFKELNAGRTFRQKLHALVYNSEYGGALHSLFDNFIVVWVVISVIAVVFESVQSIHYILNTEFIILDTVAVTIFTLEYFLRLYTCVEEPGFQHFLIGRLKQAKTTGSIIDFLAVLPFFLEVFLHHLFDLRFLRVFRLLRLLKLTRYTGATATLAKVIVREWPVMAAAGFVMMLLVVLTASLGYLFEHEAQPDKFENIPQAIYWAVITLASVGYGDITPVTPVGRFLTIILALIGIGIFAIPAALLSSAFSDQLIIEREELKDSLLKILAEGDISNEKAEIIRTEAERLHLTEHEVDKLLDLAIAERDTIDHGARLPLSQIAQDPAHAVEHFKVLVSEIRQLSILSDHSRFESFAKDNDRLTQSELALWLQLGSTVPPSQPVKSPTAPSQTTPTAPDSGPPLTAT